MLVLNAPTFQPTGDYLSADYVLDFTKDLSISIPVEGTWQGDRKKALSFYVDNYNNNFSVNISTGSGNVKIPAYTAANVNISRINEVVITSDGIATVNATLTTEPRNSSVAASRGNAPNTIAGKLNYTGSVNLGKANFLNGSYFNPDNGYIYLATSGSNLIVVDPVKLIVVEVFQGLENRLNKVIRGPGNFLIVSGNTGSSIFTFNLTTKVFVKIIAQSPGGGIAYNPSNRRLYCVSNGSVYYVTLKTDGTLEGGNTSIPIPTGMSGVFPNCVEYCSDNNAVYVGCTLPASGGFRSDVFSISPLNATQSEWFNANAGGEGLTGTTGISYIKELRILVCVASTVSAPVAESRQIISASIDNISGVKKKYGQGSGDLFGAGYCPDTKLLYLNSGDVIDMLVNSVIASMPGYGSIPTSLPAPIYIPSITQMAFARGDSILQFGR